MRLTNTMLMTQVSRTFFIIVFSILCNKSRLVFTQGEKGIKSAKETKNKIHREEKLSRMRECLMYFFGGKVFYNRNGIAVLDFLFLKLLFTMFFSKRF